MGHLSKIFWAVVMWIVAGIVITLLHETPAWSVKTFVWVVTDKWAPAGALLSTIVLLLLMMLYLGLLVRMWLDKNRLLLGELIGGGAFAVAMYIINLLLKARYEQIRPCHQLQVATECPLVGNFSYPSNHTVIAFGLATGLAFALPGLAYLAYPLAIVEGVSRVIAGHHYPHDVLAGATLGMLGVLGALWASQFLILASFGDRGESRLAASDANVRR